MEHWFLTLFLCALFIYTLVVSAMVTYWAHTKSLDAHGQTVLILTGFSIGALFSAAVSVGILFYASPQ
jgi:hypothetical protein